MTPAPSLPPPTVTAMTPSAIAAAVPAPSPSPTPFLERLRPRRAHVAAGLGLGVAFALLVDGVPVGLGASSSHTPHFDRRAATSWRRGRQAVSVRRSRPARFDA